MNNLDYEYKINELSKILGVGWYIYPTRLNLANINKSNITLQINQIFCVHCKSKNLALVGFDNYRIISGNSSEWAFECKDCGNYMTLIKEYN